MGVTGLWTVVHPCARPIKLDTLNKKRLAIDASIWIYQFLKAVRDKEGNQLRNSHVVGFFRRICKLLFVGIKPIFVFDGGAPALKRQTISGRKRRREGRREDAARTAGRLLALQVQRLAEQEDTRRKDTVDEDEHRVPENVVYVDEITMSPAERQKSRHFRKKDAYHLPELEVSMAEMGQPNDPRIMSLEELQQYAHQFNSGEDINVYDFSKIDYESQFFQSLPPSDQYNILNAARLRSRLRMGYSKDQLDGMFPDRMAFSRFQIERVTERNELTQRLMRLQGMNEDGTLTMDTSTRVAGEKGREYVLVKNDGVEGGWALGVVNTTGGMDKPIDVDSLDKPPDNEASDEDEDEFEDVPIEGLNRLPKPKPQSQNPATHIMSASARQRRQFYKSRQQDGARANKKTQTDPDSLFVEQSDEELDNPDRQSITEDDVDLQQAIALSMQQDHEPELEPEGTEKKKVNFRPQKRVEEPVPFSKGRGTRIAHLANARASKETMKPAMPFEDEVEDSTDEDDVTFQKALTKPRNPTPPEPSSKQENTPLPKFPGFDGPLPFEKLDLGQSLFSKKKKPTEPTDSSGGFLIEDLDAENKKNSKPLPPWFNAKSSSKTAAPVQDEEPADSTRDMEIDFEFEQRPKTQISRQPEVIDLEKQDGETGTAGFDTHMSKQQRPIVISDDGKISDVIDVDKIPNEREEDSLVSAAMPGISSDESAAAVTMTVDRAEDEDEDEDEDEMEWEEVEIADQARSNPVKEHSKVSENIPSFEPQRAGIANVGQNNNDFGEIQGGNPSLDRDRNAGSADALDDEFNYSDPEEEELFRQIAKEEEEHLRFASSLNNRSLADNVKEYEEELKKLRQQHKSDLRDADEVTQSMITECQQLLSLFGLPYITAPMEAEAQCAELVRLGLVDGIVTDDSDCFLFGGTRVYKNMFNQAKMVEVYLSTDLEAEFGFTRQRLISIAQLLGSDYTEGLPGVGPVTALEIISEFDNLSNFRNWWTAVQNGTRPKEDDAMNAFRKSFRRNITKVFLPTAFPDARVDEAYLLPEVDSDPSDFVWGVPDLAALRAFLTHTVGWSPERTDEILVPVIRDMNRRGNEGTQSNITRFFEGSVGAGAFAPRKRAEGGSKRLQTALQKIGEKSGGISKPESSASGRAASTAKKKHSKDDEEYDSDVVPAQKGKRKRKI